MAYMALCFASAQWDLRSTVDQQRKERANELMHDLLQPLKKELRVGIIGAGRMGSHLAATWARAGVHVTLGSKDSAKSKR